MSYNGSGTFSINTSGQPVVTGTTISSTVFNALTSDLATGLSTAICKDGQTTITANIPMAGFKFTGLGAGSAAGQSVRYEQLGFSPYTTTATAAGTTTLTVSSTQTQYFTGTTTQTVVMPVVSTLTLGQTFIVVNTSTGIVTVKASDASSNILAIPAKTQATFTVIAITGTDNTSWNVEVSGFATVTGTGSVALATSPTFVTPTLGVASATSINFGQTALSYYGEGTWTPSLGGNTTYTTQTGIYTRVGRLINCQAELNINSIGTGSTSTVTGLPFTVNGVASGQVGTFSTLATNVLGFWCYATSTLVTFQSLTAAGTSATNSPAIFGSSATIRFSVTHHI